MVPTASCFPVADPKTMPHPKETSPSAETSPLLSDHQDSKSSHRDVKSIPYDINEDDRQDAVSAEKEDDRGRKSSADGLRRRRSSNDPKSAEDIRRSSLEEARRNSLRKDSVAEEAAANGEPRMKGERKNSYESTSIERKHSVNGNGLKLPRVDEKKSTEPEAALFPPNSDFVNDTDGKKKPEEGNKSAFQNESKRHDYFVQDHVPSAPAPSNDHEVDKGTRRPKSSSETPTMFEDRPTSPKAQLESRSQRVGVTINLYARGVDTLQVGDTYNQRYDGVCDPLLGASGNEEVDESDND